MERKEVRNDVVVLDYGSFSDTNFIGCKIIYRGGRPPTLLNCDLIDCEWIFEGPALNTVGFLRSLVASDGVRPFVLHGVLGLPENE